MYKFNFLNKINQERLETKKRERFIQLVFLSSAAVTFLLAITLYAIGLGIKSDYKTAMENKGRIEADIKEVRNNNFFKYKLSENVYNSMQKRRKSTEIMAAFESSMDSSIVINDLILDNQDMVLTFIIRSSGSKSQLMSWVVNFKDQVNERLIKLNLADAKNNALSLTRGPDVKGGSGKFSYWNFALSLKFKKPNLEGKKK
jgi:hypothetical protein